MQQEGSISSASRCFGRDVGTCGATSLAYVRSLELRKGRSQTAAQSEPCDLLKGQTVLSQNWQQPPGAGLLGDAVSCLSFSSKTGLAGS